MPKPTKEQQNILGHKQNIIVSASAGSGKTTVMIAKILELLKDGADIMRILVVTFGNASAADMAKKLQEKIEEALADSETGEDVRLVLRRQLYKLQLANISTLHSFCASQLRIYGERLNIDRGFTVLQESDALLKKNKAFDTVVMRELENGGRDFFECYDVMCRKRNTKRLKAAVFKVYGLISTMSEPSLFEDLVLNKKPDYKSVIEKYIGLCRSHFDYKLRCLTEFYPAETPYQKYAVEMKVHILSKEFGYTRPQFEAIRQIKGAEDAEEYKICLQEFKKELTACINNLTATTSLPDFEAISDGGGNAGGIASELVRLAGELKKQYAVLKEEACALDFNDLEQHMAHLLDLGDETAEAVRAQFDYIFVDEYQDINPLQERIIKNFGNHAVRFFVGDVKQSIYGFRLCEPQIFLDKFKDMSPAGDSFSLNQNFRSGGGIIEFVNTVFSKLMTHSFGGVDYEETAKMNTAKQVTDTEVSIYVVAKSPVSESSEEENEDGDAEGKSQSLPVYSVRDDKAEEVKTSLPYLEGCLVADIIYKQMEKGLVLSDGERREVKFSDIVILSRNLTSANAQLCKGLKDCGVPVCRPRKVNLFKSASVVRLIDFLRVLYNPKQDLPLASVMKSFFKFSPEELAEIRLSAPGQEYFYEAVAEKMWDGSLTAVKLKNMFLKIDGYALKAGYLPPSEILSQIIVEFDYISEAAVSLEGADGAECARAFLDMAEQSVFDDSLVSFINYIDMFEGELEVSLKNTPADAVRVMSIHQSKGLEFPVVILAGTSAQFSSKTFREEIVADRNLGVGALTYHAGKRELSDNLHRSACIMSAKLKEREEELRLLYVALTRAKDRLFITGSFSPETMLYKPDPYLLLNAPDMLTWILSALYGTERGRQMPFCSLSLPDDETTDCQGLNETVKAEVAASTEKETRVSWDTNIIYAKNIFAGKVESRPIIYKDSGEIFSALKNRHAFVYDLSLNDAPKLTVSQLNKSLREETEELYLPPSGIALAVDTERAAAGSAYHKVMQYIDFSATSEEKAEAEILKLKNNGSLSAAEAALVEPKRVAAACSNPLLHIENAKYYRERSFLLRLAKSDGRFGGEGVLVQGVIDLLIFTDGGLIVADYKTGSNNLGEVYKYQLELYCLAAERILGKKVLNSAIIAI